jgi:hypothetical protein
MLIVSDCFHSSKVLLAVASCFVTVAGYVIDQLYGTWMPHWSNHMQRCCAARFRCQVLQLYERCHHLHNAQHATHIRIMTSTIVYVAMGACSMCVQSYVLTVSTDYVSQEVHQQLAWAEKAVRAKKAVCWSYASTQKRDKSTKSMTITWAWIDRTRQAGDRQVTKIRCLLRQKLASAGLARHWE